MINSCCDCIFSEKNIDFYHIQHQDNIIDITNKKCKIIAASIFVGIFTLGIGGVLTAYMLSGHYKWKKVKRLNNVHHAATSTQSFQGTARQDHLNTLPIENLKGFKNVGATCALASALQLLKRHPTIRAALDRDVLPYTIPLNDDQYETDDQFKLRCQIIKELKQIVEASDKNTAPGAVLINFRKLLVSYEKSCGFDQIKDGPGDTFHIFEALFRLLDLDYEIGNFTSNGDSSFSCFYEGIGTPIIISVECEVQARIAVLSEGTSEPLYVYELVGFNTSYGGHSIAYIKNQNDSFTVFDDDKIRIHKGNFPKHIHCCLYKLVSF